MGTWGVDSFGNDDAADWAWQFDEVDGLSLLSETLDKVFDESESDDYVEAPTGSEAIAACEVIARMQGNFGQRTPYSETADRWVANHGQKPEPQLVAKANKALDILVSDKSELYQLWQESDEFSSWQASIADLRLRINS